MTREEQINEAVETYMNGLFEDGIEIPIEDYENIEEGFVAGAKWADEHPKNVWHDASEEPSKACPIMIEIDDDIDPTYDVITVDGKDEKFWKFLASDRDITRWAYISDLLPKTK